MKNTMNTVHFMVSGWGVFRVTTDDFRGRQWGNVDKITR